MISLKNVHKQFGSKIAVDGLNLKVERGEIYAFLGPNGAGKTTTIKMMTGLLRPTSGEVTIDGMDVFARGVEVRRILGYIPDQPFLYDKLTGREFLSFIADIYRVDGAGRPRMIEEYIEMLSMRDFANDLAEGYSHGMKQRLAIAAMLLHRPDVIVVDEPMVGLDPQTMRTVKELFLREAKRGVALFMSTHIIALAEEIADRVGIIIDGRLIAEGTGGDLVASAKTDGRLEDAVRLEEAFLKIVDDVPHGGAPQNGGQGNDRAVNS